MKTLEQNIDEQIERNDRRIEFNRELLQADARREMGPTSREIVIFEVAATALMAAALWILQ